MAQMETLALQREVRLGMLYDCCKDALLPGAPLWDENTLGKNIHLKPNPGTESSIIESDTLQDKMAALKVPEWLQASLLCVLLEPRGAAQYLQDSKSSCRQARVALLYTVTTKHKQIDVTKLPRPEDCKVPTATHVVTEVLYGAQAVFVFDQEVSPSEDPQEIQKSLQAKVRKILSGATEGIAKEKTGGGKITCKIYSDVPLEDHPMTYQQTMNIFSTFPEHLVERAVPLRIWLYPLNKLGSKITCHFHEVSSEIISEVQNVLQQLTEIDKRRNDLAENPAALTFPEIKKKLQQFQSLCQQYRQTLQKQLSRTIPIIRQGAEEEDALMDLLTNKQQALFSSQQLSAFLDRREQEVAFVNSYLDVLKDVDVVSTKKELDRLLFNPVLKKVIAFMFTSLHDGDSYLSDLENSLAVKKSCHTVPVSSASGKLWFEHQEISKKARASARAFLALANMGSNDTKLIVSALPDQDHPGVSIYLYEDGELVSTNLDPPSISKVHQGPRVAGSDSTVQEGEVQPKDTDEGRNGNPFQETTRKEPHDRRGREEPVYRADFAVSPEKPVTSPPPKKDDERVKAEMIKQSTLISNEGLLQFYRLPLKKSASSCDDFLKYTLGREEPKRPHKVIMVMGATGAGKTTLINGMINYILGVKWEDGFRFKLVHEQTNRSQAESQTSDVTAYEIHFQKGFQIPYSLTIIDTPGFGDTRGLQHDRQIITKVQEFFSTPGGIDHIDGVCFVVQASLARLTHPQKYVFDSVLSIFGKDIESNIMILVTFADGQFPPVLAAILESKVPCAKDDNENPVHFKFNNSALFVSSSTAGENTLNFDAMFWKMGTASMKTFFQSLNSLEPRSLTLTKEVLQERKSLEAAVEGLQPQIKAGLSTLESLRKTKWALEQHKDEMDANKDFEVEVERTVAKRIDITGEFITNCQKCHCTCHYPCYIPDDKKKDRCSAMNRKGDCEVCPGKCRWNVHFNQKYRWVYETEKQKQTYAQIKEKYEKACGQAMTTEKIFQQLREEYEVMESAVFSLIEQSSRSIQRLQEIALKPNPMATPEHIDLLIQAEQQEAKPGFQDRVQSLQGVREMAVIVDKIARKEPLLPEDEIVARKCKSKTSKGQKILRMLTSWLPSI
ncbi:uncharacterized protein LOC132578061 [Heteronotia binoei]|uniref:uncharacterized protein LOC132578061 n=1 Tax=Heteronotia binoei TaxID=13085 RepID=UPI0029319F38|nr:uncharacterized protein LOC132578061 [Heteronotia binoei]